MIHKEETDEHADISFKVAADAACRDRFYNRNNCGAPDATGGRECFEAFRQRHRMGDLRSHLFRATLQPAKPNRYDERQPPGSCVVLRGRIRRWTTGSNATVRKR